MSIQVVDRRNNPKGKSSENRQRLLKRLENQIQKALPDIIKNTNVKDITGSGEQVKIPIKGVGEPQFSYQPGTGNHHHVQPGNKQFSPGDTFKKPPKGGAGGSGSGQQGSNDPSPSEDDFFVSISREEFLDYFFADLELPDMVKKHLNTIVDFKQKRAGYSNQGTPNRLNIVRSYQNSMSRRMAGALYFDKQIEKLEKRLLEETLSEEEITKIKMDIERLRKLKNAMSFMEETDLRYNNFEQYPVPITSAVMFCIMDVSGSMGEKEKDIAKRFFMLLYLFLTKQYERIEIVFIRHHTEAKEVNEFDFFNSKESGGTVVAPALELMRKIINERYATNWNIYSAQVSDGDVWNKSDAEDCGKLMLNELLPKIQYANYIEVCRNTPSDLWDVYQSVKSKRNNFEIGKIHEVSQIWSVFQDFYKKKTTVL